jgi:AbrB family looped-hinge helix DNA binding protein
MAGFRTSTVSSKGQITLPKSIREHLGVGPGSTVRYELQDGVVLLMRSDPLDLAFHEALASTLEEWTTPEDEEAFRDL